MRKGWKLIAQILHGGFGFAILVKVTNCWLGHRVGDIQVPSCGRKLWAGCGQFTHIAQSTGTAKRDQTRYVDQPLTGGKIDHDVGGWLGRIQRSLNVFGAKRLLRAG